MGKKMLRLCRMLRGTTRSEFVTQEMDWETKLHIHFSPPLVFVILIFVFIYRRGQPPTFMNPFSSTNISPIRSSVTVSFGHIVFSLTPPAYFIALSCLQNLCSLLR